MILWLIASSALGAGGGLYVGLAGGAASTDSTGFVARGTATELGLGGYVGNYRHTFRYGKYWQVGFSGKISRVDVFGGSVDVNSATGVKLTRGIDVMNLGAWWSVAAGPSFVYRAKSLSRLLDRENLGAPSVGGFLRVGVGIAYNFTHGVAVNVRYEPGIQIDADGVSNLGGFGAGLLLRAPLVRHNFRKDD